jgi:uncharacterized protein with beta-barrel porin domain
MIDMELADPRNRQPLVDRQPLVEINRMFNEVTQSVINNNGGVDLDVNKGVNLANAGIALQLHGYDHNLLPNELKNKITFNYVFDVELISKNKYKLGDVAINNVQYFSDQYFVGNNRITKIEFGYINNGNIQGVGAGIELKFNEKVVFDGNITNHNQLAQGVIKLSGDMEINGSVAQLAVFEVGKQKKSNLIINNSYEVFETVLYNDSTLTINASSVKVSTGGINFNGQGEGGNLVINGNKNVEFSNDLGAMQAATDLLTSITINNTAAVTFKGDIYTNQFTLNAGNITINNDAKLHLGSGGLYFDPNGANAGNLAGKVQLVNNNQGYIGVLGNYNYMNRTFSNLQTQLLVLNNGQQFANTIGIGKGGTINVANNETLTHKVVTNENGNGILNLTGTRDITGDIGTTLAKLKEVNFKGHNNADATINITKDIFAKEINLQNMGANGHKLKFADNAGFDGHLKTSVADKGIIEFSGNVRVGAIGAQNLALKSMAFTNHNNGQARRRLFGDIWVGKVDFDAGKFEVDKSLVVHSQNITINGSKFEVGDNKIVFDGGHGPTITINGNIVFNVGDGGSVVFQDSRAITVNAGSITANVTGPYNAAPITFNNILGNASQVTVNNQNQQNPQPQQNKAQQQNRPAAGGAAAAGAAAAKQQQTPVSINQIPELVKDRVTKESLTRIVEDLDDISKGKNISNTAERDEFVHNIETLSVEQVKQYVDQVVDFTNTLKEELIFEHRGLAQEVSSVLESRMTELTAPISAAPIVAPAAGDEDPRNGVWIGGFAGNNANKKGLKTKNNFSGASIGYERFVNDTDAVGFAITNIRSNSKYGSSIKNTSNNFIASLYGFTDINGLILSGSIFGGQGKFKSSRDVVSAGGGLTAKGNFKSRIYGAQGGMAYQIMQDQHVITPSFGLQYSAITQGKYKETGAGVSNREIGKKSSSVLIGTFATKYGYIIQNDNTIVIPSIQVGVASELSAKSSNVKTKFLWQEQANSFKADTKRQTRLFVTPSISAKSDAFDFSLAYTFDKAKKATGHMVALKLMTKF